MTPYKILIIIRKNLTFNYIVMPLILYFVTSSLYYYSIWMDERVHFFLWYMYSTNYAVLYIIFKFFCLFFDLLAWRGAHWNHQKLLEFYWFFIGGFCLFVMNLRYPDCCVVYVYISSMLNNNDCKIGTGK